METGLWARPPQNGARKHTKISHTRFNGAFKKWHIIPGCIVQRNSQNVVDVIYQWCDHIHCYMDCRWWDSRTLPINTNRLDIAVIGLYFMISLNN